MPCGNNYNKQQQRTHATPSSSSSHLIRTDDICTAKRLDDGQPFNNGFLPRHPDHTERQGHGDADGETFGDGRHGYGGRGVNRLFCLEVLEGCLNGSCRGGNRLFSVFVVRGIRGLCNGLFRGV